MIPSTRGIRRSISTTSGRCLATAAGHLVAVSGLPDDDQAVGAVEHHRQAGPHQGVVVHEQDPDLARHAAGGPRRQSRSFRPRQPGVQQELAVASTGHQACRRPAQAARSARSAPSRSPAPAHGEPPQRGRARREPPQRRPRADASRLTTLTSRPAPGPPPSVTRAGAPGACLRTLVSPSCTTRYAVRPASVRHPGKRQGNRPVARPRPAADLDPHARRAGLLDQLAAGRRCRAAAACPPRRQVGQLVVPQHADDLPQLVQGLVRHRSGPPRRRGKAARAARPAGRRAPRRRWRAATAGARARRASRGRSWPARPRGPRPPAGPGRPRRARPARAARRSAPGSRGPACPSRRARRRRRRPAPYQPYGSPETGRQAPRIRCAAIPVPATASATAKPPPAGDEQDGHRGGRGGRRGHGREHGQQHRRPAPASGRAAGRARGSRRRRRCQARGKTRCRCPRSSGPTSTAMAQVQTTGSSARTAPPAAGVSAGGGGWSRATLRRPAQLPSLRLRPVSDHRPKYAAEADQGRPRPPTAGRCARRPPGANHGCHDHSRCFQPAHSTSRSPAAT